MIVEGKDDRWTIISLLSRHGYDWEDESIIRPYVAEVGGVEEVIKALGAALKTYSRFGIVLDADSRPDERWARVRERFREIGVTIPASPVEGGCLAELSGFTAARMGIWLMLDNRTPGILEDFVRTLVPTGDKCLSHADITTAQARSLGAPLHDSDHQKGVIHTWLAWRETPGQPFGTALKARVFDDASPIAISFVSWFERLFVK